MTVKSVRTRRMTIVDDDLMSREVLTLLAMEAGFEVAAFETGEAALESLTEPDASCPEIVLADMQMPGISGNSLARLLRSACGAGTRLIAMSGTAVLEEHRSSFDAFLLKPFSMEDVLAAMEDSAASAARPDGEPEYAGALNRTIYESFAKSMSPEQVGQLYAMSLDDADARIEGMRAALAAGDADAYRRAAHSIKGGCGMVGAVELAALAAKMEEFGPQAVDNVGPLTQFLSASARLRRILDALRE